MNPTRTRAMRCLAAAVTLLGLLGWLSGCGGGAGGDPAVRQTVTAAGGSVTSADGSLVLTIPAGALGNDTEITITELSAERQSAAVQALGPHKVYRLEPAGLQFAQPVAAVIQLPPSAVGLVSVLRVYSAGRWEAAAAQRLVLSADGRQLSGQLNHFSELVILNTTVTHTLKIEPRRILTGEVLEVALRVTSSGEDELAVHEDVFGLGESGVLHEFRLSALPRVGSSELIEGVDTRTLGNRTLFARIESSFTRISRYRCLKPHWGTVYYERQLEVIDSGLTVPWFHKIDIWGQGDYSCEDREPQPPPPPPPPTAQTIQTGLFPARRGFDSLDGIIVVLKTWAVVRAYVALIVGSTGLVGIDLTTGQEALDLSATGTAGQPGNGPALDVVAVSQPDPGASSPAGVFVASAAGSAGAKGYVRFNDGSLGWSQTLLLGRVLDFAAAGAALVSDEVVAVAPATGIVPYRWDGSGYRFSGTGGVAAFNFDGTLQSAALPEVGVGKGLLALTAGSDNGSTSTVWYHSRAASTPPVKLFSMIPGANAARRLRCRTWDTVVALMGKTVCAATEPGGTVSFFDYDPARPSDTPQVRTHAVGAGATGVQFGTAADGNPWAVVANFNANTLNVFRLDLAGTVLSNTSVPVATGCLNPGHAAPFTDGAKNYIAYTCNGSNHYGVMQWDF